MVPRLEIAAREFMEETGHSVLRGNGGAEEGSRVSCATRPDRQTTRLRDGGKLRRLLPRVSRRSSL
jgi:hypothetical protein